jgi:hypothetical protein
LPFRIGGVWTLKLSVSTATGNLQDATATFEVLDEAGNEVTTPPAGGSVPTQVELIDPSTTAAPFATTTTIASATSPPTVPPDG